MKQESAAGLMLQGAQLNQQSPNYTREVSRVSENFGFKQAPTLSINLADRKAEIRVMVEPKNKDKDLKSQKRNQLNIKQKTHN